MTAKYKRSRQTESMEEETGRAEQSRPGVEYAVRFTGDGPMGVDAAWIGRKRKRLDLSSALHEQQKGLPLWHMTEGSLKFGCPIGLRWTLSTLFHAGAWQPISPIQTASVTNLGSASRLTHLEFREDL